MSTCTRHTVVACRQSIWKHLISICGVCHLKSTWTILGGACSTDIIIMIIIIIMGRMGICFTSVATSWWGEACCLLLCFPTGTCVLCCTFCVLCIAYCVAVLNFDYLGECSQWGTRGRVAQPTSDENLRYITPGTSLVSEAPPMPLRASSHPGSPNSPSCSALAWYFCWPGLSPWGESWKRTRVARTAALTRYRYATQPTLHKRTYH